MQNNFVLKLFHFVWDESPVAKNVCTLPLSRFHPRFKVIVDNVQSLIEEEERDQEARGISTDKRRTLRN